MKQFHVAMLLGAGFLAALAVGLHAHQQTLPGASAETPNGAAASSRAGSPATPSVKWAPMAAENVPKDAAANAAAADQAALEAALARAALARAGKGAATLLTPAHIDAAKRLYTSLDYGSLYRDLAGKEAPLGDDELSLLGALLTRCLMVQAAVASYRQDQSAGNARPAALAPARLEALQRLEGACADVPSEVVANAGAEQRTELGRRHSLDPWYRSSVEFVGLLASGRGRLAVDELEGYLAIPDPLLMSNFASFLTRRFTEAGLAAEWEARGMPLDQLGIAWTLVGCDLSGGCGRQSLPVNVDCLLGNRCAVESLDESIARYSSPARIEAIRNWREHLLAAYRTGDWTWLHLDALRQRMPPIDH